MKNFILLLFAASLTLAAASCNKENLNSTSGNRNGTPDEIAFRSKGLEIDVTSKATAVETLTSFYVSASTGTAGTNDKYVWKSVSFSKSGDIYTGGKYWPDKDPKYHFYASNVDFNCTDGSAPTISINGISDDIVCAVCASPTHRDVNSLTFNHIFTRLGSVTVSGPENGYELSNVSIKFTPKTKGKYNLFTGKDKTDGTGWTDTVAGSETEIASSDGQAKQNDIYLIPGTYVLNVKYTLIKGDYSREFTNTKEIVLVSGKINSIKAAIPEPGSDQEAKDIVFTIELTKWEPNEMSISF